MERYAHDEVAAAQDLAANDLWLAEHPATAPLRDPAYRMLRALPPLEAQIMAGYHRMSGSRTMIVLPMGGAVPGGINYDSACQWCANHEVDPQDWDPIFELWDELDQITAEARDGSSADEETVTGGAADG